MGRNRDQQSDLFTAHLFIGIKSKCFILLLINHFWFSVRSSTYTYVYLYTPGQSGSCCDPISTATIATITTLSSAKSTLLSQNQDVNPCDRDTAIIAGSTVIIAGSTVGGCLFLSTFLMGTYLLCRKDSCCRSSVFPICGPR